jgi:predicted TIM-barrel fold metal-dependent hydrolase
MARSHVVAMEVRMKTIAVAALLSVLAGTAGIHAVAANSIPMVDAHSQIEPGVPVEKVISLMDKAGIVHSILATRGRIDHLTAAEYARLYPDRITAADRTKGRVFTENKPNFRRMLDVQLAAPEFRAMAEVILWHAQKGTKAPEQVVALASPQAQIAFNTALTRRWPFVPHYEFAAMGNAARKQRMEELEGALRAHPDHPFALIHMGQLRADAAARLLDAHPNVHFMVSHSNPVSTRASGQPWTQLFEGERIAPEWRAVIDNHPDRFILNFVNVFAEHWGDFYLDQAKLWQRALQDLPPDIANAIAHGNAVRLWKLPQVVK